MTVTPEGLTITGPEDVFTHGEVYRFLRGRKKRLYEEVAKATTVYLTYEGFSSTFIKSTTPLRIGITVCLRQSQTFRWIPWSTALHEWGHAVTLYHRHATHNRYFWNPYLEQRGLLDHPKLNTSYAWQVEEMIAEDYRMCFSNDRGLAERPGHMNRELPALDVVAGRRWFNGAWRGL